MLCHTDNTLYGPADLLKGPHNCCGFIVTELRLVYRVPNLCVDSQRKKKAKEGCSSLSEGDQASIIT